MKTLVRALCVGVALSFAAANIGLAETATTPTTPSTTPAPTSTTPTTPPPKKASKPRSAKSIECSRLADEKGLKGKPRKRFRSKCLAGKT